MSRNGTEIPDLHHCRISIGLGETIDVVNASFCNCDAEKRNANLGSSAFLQSLKKRQFGCQALKKVKRHSLHHGQSLKEHVSQTRARLIFEFTCEKEGVGSKTRRKTFYSRENSLNLVMK